MIEGGKINLRAPDMGDIDRMARWMNDRDVTRNLAFRYQLSIAAEEAWLRDRTSQPMSYTQTSFAIETKDGAHIGGCGIHTGQVESRVASVGIYIGEKERWGHGYGTDAVRTLVRFGFEEMNLNRIWLHVFASNERAIASYLKCGYVEEGRLRQSHFADGVYSDVVTMAILREEWAAANSG
jgi:RimJ/RimL family protein N-acetyltransferase